LDWKTKLYVALFLAVSGTILVYYGNGIPSFVGGICIIAAALISYMEQKEINAISRIKGAFREAGYPPDEVEKMTELAILMLKEETADWTNFDQIKLTTIVQTISATKKRPPN
jgi:hypothetical protein